MQSKETWRHFLLECTHSKQLRLGLAKEIDEMGEHKKLTEWAKILRGESTARDAGEWEFTRMITGRIDTGQTGKIKSAPVANQLIRLIKIVHHHFTERMNNKNRRAKVDSFMERARQAKDKEDIIDDDQEDDHGRYNDI